MKKEYQKPDAEYISLAAEEEIAGIIEGEMSNGDLPEGWE